MPFTYQKWIKLESERSIISGLYEGDKSFSDLADLTDLSKPVLSERLKELTKEGKIAIVPDIETKRFLYRLIRENLDTVDEVQIKVHILSKIVMAYLTGFAKDLSISDEKYATRLGECVLILFNLRLLSYMVAPLDLQEQWLKNTLGSEFVSKLSQVYPKNRNILKYIAKGISSKELTILTTEDPEEAAHEINELIDSIIEAVTKK